LRKALDEARAEQTRQAAQRARDLAEAQRELAKASQETERKASAGRLAELARKQEELARQAAETAPRTENPTGAAQRKPLDPSEARAAARALDQGEAEEAVKHQEKSAGDLDRLANELEQASRLARDPQEAARQLARLQDDVSKRTRAE